MDEKSHDFRMFFILYSMKKYFPALVLTLSLLPALAACGGYDYAAHLSEVRSDLFCAQTEEFSVTLACISREYPYNTDGVAGNMSDLVEISLTSTRAEITDYSVWVTDGKEWGGEMSFRNTRGDYFYSQGVSVFPEQSVSLRIEWESESRELTATSVKNESTLTPAEALGCAVKAEKETVTRMKQNGVFCGEFHVRLLRRDKNYYYVGIVASGGATVSLLLDSESGEVLARRESR